MGKLPEYFAEIEKQVHNKLDQLLDDRLSPAVHLLQAMRYSAISTGKMLRPVLAIKSAELFNIPMEISLNIAVAIELVHVYSLIHDDLPAIDNDDTRRGKPSCHIAYGESTAILAGNSLLTLAFELISDCNTPYSDHNVRELVSLLSKAIGYQGLLAGQMLDLMSENKILQLTEITVLQELKTARLFAFACASGAIIGGADKTQRQKLYNFGNNLGHGFQIIDDLLDVSGNQDLVGKKLGKDNVAGKATYINLIGLDETKLKASAYINSALAALDEFGERANSLRDLAKFIISREY